MRKDNICVDQDEKDVKNYLVRILRQTSNKCFNKQSLKFCIFEIEKFQQRNRVMKYNQGEFLDLKNIITEVQKKQWD